MADVAEIIEALTDAYAMGDPEPLLSRATDDVVFDFSRSRSPYRGVYTGKDEARALFREARSAWGQVEWHADVVADLGGGRLVLTSRMHVVGAGSGIEFDARGGQAWTLRDGRVARIELHQTPEDAIRSIRLARLERSRLYFVCDSAAGTGELLRAAVGGGADMLQLRDKQPESDEALLVAAARFRDASRAAEGLFVLNDRPDLVARAEADGAHVGQHDRPVAEARRQAGGGTIVGLSTHSRDELDAACAATGEARPDYLSVGPVWETPTKEGRPATGLDYVRYAAANATLPWFAIGGIDASNVGEVVAAGATRVVVVRAIRDATDPAAAARALRESLDG